MPLTVRYVSCLEEVVEPAVAFLGRDRDLFATPRIVVPNAGTRAWLSAVLAARLGTSGVADGVLANVDVCFPTALARLLEKPGLRDDDPWEIAPLTFAALAALDRSRDRAGLVARFGGPLLAARAMAERFDDYHVRRPGMIREWDHGRANLSPTADAPSSPRRLPDSGLPQWRLWKAVRAASTVPPPPCREPAADAEHQVDVFVAGLEHLSCQQIGWLEALGARGDVQVLLVHPSPALRERWAATAPQPSPGHAPRREEHVREAGVDPLVSAWLRGTRETQWLLASQGIAPRHDVAAPPAAATSATAPPAAATSATAAPAAAASATATPAAATLLTRLRHTVVAGGAPAPAPIAADDVSVRIHRCHGLGRQAEVLHDALLHAFREIPGLEPHEVAIVSPCIEEAAPHLEAVFSRTLGGDSGGMHLPLLVADRGIRELSPGAELLTELLALPGSRYPIDAVLAVAAHPLVLERFDLDDEGTAVWDRCLRRTQVRWGLDDAQRKTAGLDAPGLRAHTWRLGLEQMLLGATLPDAVPREELGGVVPLDDVEPAQIDAIAALVTVLGVVAELDAATAADRPVAEWCTLVESTLDRLCDPESPALDEPRRAIDGLRRGANGVAVPFHDVKTLLGDALDAPSGRRPLRTGAITATSMVPLRGVPYRVIGVIGYDDRAVSAGEARGDDLVAAQELLGDIDPRLEVRRSLLDCVLACRDRLIVTCTGMDVANNETLPLVTPLAELVDFARRHGVADVRRGAATFSGIETVHPRHAVSPGNFRPGVLHPREAWSHDEQALRAAQGLRRPASDVVTTAVAPARLAVVELKALEELVLDPLAPFVRRTLDINTWEGDDAPPPATLPLTLTAYEQRGLTADLIDLLAARPHDDGMVGAWAQSMQAGGRLPFGGFGATAREEIATVARAIVAKAAEMDMPLAGGAGHDVLLTVGRFQIVGRIERLYAPDGRILFVRPEPLGGERLRKARLSAALFLLAAIAADTGVREAHIVSPHEKWSPGGAGEVAQARAIVADPQIDVAVAGRRLEALCTLLELAATTPRGSFGDTAATVVAAGADPAAADAAGRSLFDAFVNDPRRYGWSLERVAYGPHPEFGRVFFAGSPEREFHERFAGLVTVVSKGDARYTLR